MTMDACALVYARLLAPVVAVAVDKAEDRPDDNSNCEDVASKGGGGGFQLYLFTLSLESSIVLLFVSSKNSNTYRKFPAVPRKSL